MPTSPHGPTPDQIKKVQTNLTNMQAFNDQVYSFGLAKYLNAYALLSEHDDNDLGLAVSLNIIEGAFWAAGSVGGPIGSDAVFAHDLRMRPRMTLEKFLGIKIPEVITLNIVQEFPWSFGFVLPSPISNQLPAVPSAVSGAAASAPNAQERLDQFFTTSPPAVASAAANITAVYQVTVSPPGQGEWVLRVQNGKVVGQKWRAEKPDVTLQASASDWLEITSGKVDSFARLLSRQTHRDR